MTEKSLGLKEDYNEPRTGANQPEHKHNGKKAASRTGTSACSSTAVMRAGVKDSLAEFKTEGCFLMFLSPFHISIAL